MSKTYLVGKHFILLTDHIPIDTLCKVHTQTFNRLQLAMIYFDFEIAFKKGSKMPVLQPRGCSTAGRLLEFNNRAFKDYLKTGKQPERQDTAHGKRLHCG